MKDYQGKEVNIIRLNHDVLQGVLRQRIDHKEFCTSDVEVTHYIASIKKYGGNIFPSLMVVYDDNGTIKECVGYI